MSLPSAVNQKYICDLLFPIQERDKGLPTKAQRTRVRIIEAAIDSFVEIGVEKSNFEAIANKAGLSRGLIKHYFNDILEIFEVAVKYIRIRFQEFVIKQVTKQKSPQGRMKAYVSATFEWLEVIPKYSQIWGLMFFYASIDPKFKKLNTEFAILGHQRIMNLLRPGFSKKEMALRAKQIQVIIAGSMTSLMTEEFGQDLFGFKKKTLDLCLNLAGY